MLCATTNLRLVPCLQAVLRFFSSSTLLASQQWHPIAYTVLFKAGVMGIGACCGPKRQAECGKLSLYFRTRRGPALNTKFCFSPMYR
jgi:hypothetical protein